MNKSGLFSSVPRAVALLGLLPVALILFALSFKIAARSRLIEANWDLVEAVVVDDGMTDPSGRPAVMLEYLWNGRTKRLEVWKGGGRDSLSKGQKLRYYVNPKAAADIKRAEFADLWSGPLVMGVFAVLFTGVAGLLWWLGGTAAFARPEAWIAQAAASHLEGPAAVAPLEEHGGQIEIREPSESWKANIFWGLLFGLLLVIPACFAEAGTPGWKKYGMMAAGGMWMVFMVRCAIQNRGRSIRCDASAITISQPFGSRTIPLHEVRKVTRNDVRKKFRALSEFGMTEREKSRRMDTLAETVIITLYNANNEELLRLDNNMQPRTEMQRFLHRLEKQTGQPIADV